MSQRPGIPPGALSPDEALARYETALSWLKDRARVGGGSRFELYLRHLQLERWGKENDKGIVSQALVELHELSRIYDAFSHRDEAPFIEKLAKIPAGAPLPFGETGASHSRNFQFELFTAAELHLKGLPVLFEEPDIIVNAQSRLVGIAVKRPRRIERVRERVGEAVGQLYARGGRITHGVIALDVSPILCDRPGAMVFADLPKGSVIAPFVEKLANEVIARDRLRPMLRNGNHRLACGVWLYARIPYVVTRVGGLLVSGNFRMLYPDNTYDDTIRLLQDGLGQVQ